MASSSSSESPNATRTDLHPVCGVFRAMDDPSYGFEVPYRAQEFVVGRELQCDQPLLGEGTLSRFHCVINTAISVDRKTYLVYVTDHSKNGSFINNTQLEHKKPVLITSGSVVSFGGPQGDGISFTFAQYSPASLHARYLFVQKELGRGTFGTVVEAVNRTTGSSVAIKIIPLSGQNGSPEEEERQRMVIEREMSLMASISHPNIVRLEDVVIENRNVYLIMELARYGNLSSLINQQKRIGEQDAKVIAEQLCSALACLHNANIIHRDIKPANILISSFVPPVIKVTDFGLAKVHDDQAPIHSMCGTPAYMAPEVSSANAAPAPYDFKVDSWSVGITIAHMLGGEIPFGEDNTQIQQGVDHRIVDWQHLPSTWSSEVRDLIVRLCHRDPTQRMSIADAVSHAWFVQRDAQPATPSAK